MATPAEKAERHFDPIDRLIAPLDRAMRTLAGAYDSTRPSPAREIPDTLPTEHQHEVAALMRVNHSGEIAAQALYQGQAFVAKSDATRESLIEAGREESDHLAWCAARIQELGSRRSLLDPLWYAGSFAIGALAGLAGDSTSLGFVAETERQVVQHLQSHLQRLPVEDVRTRAILEQMSADEERHGSAAKNAGGIELPAPARALMKLTGRIMTRTAFWL
jgi:ubiquinone biosynthesis monooxygenase Coq7